MSRICLLTFSLSAALSWGAVAAPWNLAPCNPEDPTKSDPFAQPVHRASPSAAVHVPKPFPTAASDVIEDLRYLYQSLHLERIAPEQRPKGEPVLVKGMADGTARYTVQRVENWGVDRCGWEDYIYLVTVLDGASGSEMARVVITPSGLWGERWIIAGALVPPPPLLLPEAALRGVAASYHLEGESPEYVATVGPIHCGFTKPCLAFRHDGDAYIFVREQSQDALFRIAAGEPRLALNPLDVQLGRVGVPGLPPDARLLYLGGTTWAIARRVPRPGGDSVPGGEKIDQRHDSKSQSEDDREHQEGECEGRHSVVNPVRIDTRR